MYTRYCQDVNQRPESWLPRLAEVGDRLVEEWYEIRRARSGAPRRPAPHELRASDADRERIVEVLRDALTDGRLTVVEFEERVETAYRARTLGDLASLTTDLLPPDRQPLRFEKPHVSALFKKEDRSGRWVVPAELPVTAIFGTTRLDLREAILQTNPVVIKATVFCGVLEVRVPEGVEVVRVSGDVRDRISKATPAPDAPVIEIHTKKSAGAMLGEIKVKEYSNRRRRR
ncbi:protein of unknown function [Thermostaphylospora chromogena]|uniref:DUF1707 domain-containing protein n=1 Tax=Thermostaphylospora chromogena TaxID=35622 RepID=A0A1H1B4C8_9ACTN|nr:protein of unknown function [Thermostaphylospora chromogena]